MEIGRRSTRRDNCFLCCPDDLCNTKCHPSTSPMPTPVPSTTHMPISQHNVSTTYVPSTTTLAPINQGFKGKEFFLMYIENYVYSHSSIKLRAIITSPATNANIEVITQYNSTSYHVSGLAKHIAIDANMTMRENGRTGKGVILTSDTPVSVTAFNLYMPLSTSSGGYLALPLDSLGVDYIVGTARPNKDHYEKYGTSFAVGAPYDKTVVNITLSTSGVSVPGQYHREGDKITVVLDKLDTFYIETNTTNQDLTGTRIVSDKPVAVVSGNLCSIADGGCNHLVEYLPPVSKWGTRFMVPPITNSTRGIIRIISSVSNTNVVVISDTSNKTYSVSTHVDIDTNSTQPYAISSDHPVLVQLLIYERKVALTLVPSINQFSNKLLVSPPTSTVYDNYLVVSIRTIDQSGLQLRAVNGTDLSTVGSLRFPDADGEMYSFITVSCNNNKTCSVQHTDNNVAFGVIVYGFATFEAYAYPANLML